MPRLAPLTVLAFSLAACPLAAAPTDAQIKELYHQQKYAECLAAIDVRRDTEPANTLLLSTSADCKIKLGDGQGARTDLRLLAFVDTGQVSNQGSTACLGTQTHCTLTSWGLGARLGWGAVQMRLFAAQALDDAATTRRKSWRSHVALSATF